MKRDGHGKLSAETRIPIPGVSASGAKDGRPGETLLSITTSKGYNKGALTTRASVNFYGEGFIVHAFGLGGGTGDYSAIVLSRPGRATEKAIRDLHENALTLVPQVIAAARAFYAAQAAKGATING
jgi:hypothetical protein